MNERLAFQVLLRAAIGRGVGVVVLAAACGDGSSGSDGGSGGAVGGGGGSGGSGAGAVTGGAGGSSSDGAGGLGGGAAGVGGAGGAPGQEDVERCFFVGDAACPTLAGAPRAFLCTAEGEKILAWLSGPVVDEVDGSCCYQVDVSGPDPSCGGLGRPFMVDGSARVAPVLGANAPLEDPQSGVSKYALRAYRGAYGTGWFVPVRPGKPAEPGALETLDPRVVGLGAETRRALARQWASDAAYEHASVASFGKLALELLAFGAPADLIDWAHRAAIDEVRHARASFALASAYGGEELAPGALEVGGLALATSLEELAAAAAREGCCGETGAAMVAFVQAEAAEDPAVARVLRTIADEESDHAALAFAVVAWAIRLGGEPVRRSVERAVTEHEGALVRALAASAPEEPGLRAHGRLSSREAARERLRALREIVRPSIDAVLAS
jgi:hypothetical protein